jgi:peptidyl-prolyl cis-trans isomerase A (cyclophilin A)
VDSSGTGIFNSADATLPGVNLTLTGKTSQGSPVSTTTTTDTNGAFTFNNVLPGTYGVSGTGGSVILGSPSVSGLSVTGSQTVTQNLSFRGLTPGLISMRLFLASMTSADFPFAPGGSGTGLANFRPNNTPVVISHIADVSVAKSTMTPTVINLATHISDPDLIFKIDTTDGPINVQLLDGNAPKTVTNFLNYALSGDYNNSIFHRLVLASTSGISVLQGGGFTFDSNAHTVTAITAMPPITNEFGLSNTEGTLAMAQSGGDINSATDEFFFNLVDNSSSLDPQKFAVFGQLVGSADQSVLTQLAGTPVVDESNGNSSSPFNTIPLKNYSANDAKLPTDTTASNYIMINDDTIDSTNETLSYRVSSSNTTLVTAALESDNTHLDLTYAPGQTGTAIITVKAMDRYGASVTGSFTVTVFDPAQTATVALNPTSPLATDTLTATATATDSDGEPVTLTYQWQVNGVTVQTTAKTSNLTDTLNLNGIAKPGDTVTVNVTPNDGTQNGKTVTGTATVVEPTAGTVSFSPSDPATSDTITASLTGPHANSFTYDWSVNGGNVQSDTTSDTTDTLHHTLASGDQITVKVTPSDGSSNGTPTSLSTTVNLPQAGTVALTPTTPTATGTVTATVSSATDPNGDPITLTYQWKVNNNVVQKTANTSSLTDTLNLAAISGVAVKSGDTVSVLVTPSNGTTTGTPVPPVPASVTVA